MRDLFPGWTPPDEETLSRYWGEATFAVDTSVLLDLYRYSREAREGLLEALRSLGERLWVPHHVAYEFHRNRHRVLLDQREAEEALIGELDQIRGKIDEQLSERLRRAGRRDLAPLSKAIDDGFDRLRRQLEEAEKAHTEGLGDSIRDDPLYDEVVDLCGDRIGAAFDEQRLEEVRADAEERIEKEIPPGYLDADKEGDDRFGDIILWHQLCDMAKDTGRPVVLVTDDRKSDWVWEVRGKTLGPCPELVAEMLDRAGTGFHLYTPARFLQVWEEREEGREVKEGVLDEIEASPDVVVGESGIGKSGLMALFAGALANWPPSGIFARSHHFLAGEEAVDLSLTFTTAAKHEPPAEIRVSVTYPGGSTFVREAPAVRMTGGTYVASVRYPDQFGGASVLLPGSYHVEWFAMGLRESGQLQDRRLAQEDFVVQLPHS